MAKDLFSRTAAFGGAFPADFVKLSFGREGDKNGVGALVQRVALTYQQNIARLFELGSGNFYYVGGAPRARRASIRCSGRANSSSRSIETYGDLCNPQESADRHTRGVAQTTANKG